MQNRAIHRLSLLAAAAMITFSVRADVIVLTNGNEIQGEVIHENEKSLVVRFPGGTLRLPRKNISEVQRQSRTEYLVEEGKKQRRRGNFEQAVRTLETASEENPDSSVARQHLLKARESLAVFWRDIGRYRESRELFEELIRKHPNQRKFQQHLVVLEETLRDALKQEARATEEIASGEYERAISRLTQLYEHFPDRRYEISSKLSRALIGSADEFLQRKRYREASERYRSAIAIEPRILNSVKNRMVTSHLHVLSELARNGDFKSLETGATAALDVDPANETVRYFYGLSQEGLGRPRVAAKEYLAIARVRRPSKLEESVVELRKAVETTLRGERPEGRTVSVDTARLSRYEHIQTEHFDIRHCNRGIAREVAYVAERTYEEQFEQLGCATHLRGKIKIDVYATKEEYISESGMESWSVGAHQLTRKLGVLSEHRILCYEGQHDFFTEILPHEVAHGLFNHRLNYPDSVPLWANEGYAMYAEPAYVRKHYRRILKQELRRRYLIPMDQIVAIRNYPDDRVQLFYAQSFSVCSFLIDERDIGTYVRFVKAVSTHHDLENALKMHYRIAGVAALENRWIAWLEKQR